MIFPGYRGQLDTTSRRFVYGGDRLTSMEVQRGKYRKRTDYNFPNDSTVIEERWVRRGSDAWEFLDKEQYVTEERMINDGREVTQWIGGIDAKPYKSIVERRNADDLPLSREVWHGARLHLSEQWEYDGFELIGYMKDQRRDGSNFEVRYPKQESEDGSWCEQGSCKTWSRVYEDNDLPKGWIFYHSDSENMEIIEFRYIYR